MHFTLNTAKHSLGWQTWGLLYISCVYKRQFVQTMNSTDTHIVAECSGVTFYSHFSVVFRHWFPLFSFSVFAPAFDLRSILHFWIAYCTKGGQMKCVLTPLHRKRFPYKHTCTICKSNGCSVTNSSKNEDFPQSGIWHKLTTIHNVAISGM